MFAIFLAVFKTFKALPFPRRVSFSYLQTIVMYKRNKCDIDYYIMCKIALKWAKRLNEVEAVSASDKRLRRNQELNTQFRINKTNIYKKKNEQ